MKKMRLALFVIFLNLLSFKGHAYFIAANIAEINFSKPTHILVAGIPDGLDELFIHSLLTKAHLLKETDGLSQIIIIGRNDDRKMIAERGYKIIEKNREQLKDVALENLVQKLQIIKSVDIYAHSNPVSGILLDKSIMVNQILNEENDLWPMFKGKFDKKSYMMFHGCNSGIKMAPAVALQLNVPVFAALTGTDFQSIYNDSLWSGDANSKGLKKSLDNSLSFNEEKSCAAGFCRRMKPDNTSYKGYWGDWIEGGYPAYKIFCGSNHNADCGRGAIEGVLSFPSIMPAEKVKTIENFKEVVQDFLCPFSYDPKKQAECSEALESSLAGGGNPQYSPFKGVTLNCDFLKCYAHFNCKNSSSGSCHLINEKPGKNDSFTNEYNFLIQAYEKAIAEQSQK